MGLENFERELAEQHSKAQKRKRERSGKLDGESHRHHHHHRHHHGHPHSSRRKRESSPPRESRHKHTHLHDDERKDSPGEPHIDRSRHRPDASAERLVDAITTTADSGPQQRDTWMQGPSALRVDYHRRTEKSPAPSQFIRATETDYTIPPRENEIAEADNPVELPVLPLEDASSQHKVTYTFGDAGSSWRMTKLQATYRHAKETGRSLEEVAVERYDDLRAYDDAREEELELDRRDRYGKEYIGKAKPSGELYLQRKLVTGALEPAQETAANYKSLGDDQSMAEPPSPSASMTTTLDQTALNKLKAQMMKAKIRHAPNAKQLEIEYDAALAKAARTPVADVIVLNKIDSRMLTGGRSGDFTSVGTKRGQERQLVEENEDMSIEDMVKNERRTRGQSGGEGRAFAERIAKDVKFDNDLDYMDDNAAKLAKTARKSEVNLRNTAIGDYQKTKRILDACPLCHHEDTGRAPQAPIVSLATRTFLTLPTSPEITPYGLCASIVPTQHRFSLLDCDDDEWEEIRNFMKSLTRFYWSRTPRLSVIFYENAAHEGRKRHASMEAVPLPSDLAASAPAFFKEAILTTDEEWTQHRKIIDTLAKANDGLGKLAFRRSMVSNLPYFHVWFSLDGGMGHVVEDTKRWPKGDLFAREIIGGMLDVNAEVIRRQGRWRSGDLEMERRTKDFNKGWKAWDWTAALVGGE